MSRGYRLTRRAENSLVEIALWTLERFGPRQTDLYEAELLARCDAIARGEAVSHSCALLIEGAGNLRYTRAGEHFLIWLDRPGTVIVVDVLHARCDLPRHIAALSGQGGIPK